MKGLIHGWRAFGQFGVFCDDGTRMIWLLARYFPYSTCTHLVEKDVETGYMLLRDVGVYVLPHMLLLSLCLPSPDDRYKHAGQSSQFKDRV